MKFRERKNKGALSVLDEVPVIDFTPQVSKEEKTAIEEQTKFADAPLEIRKKSLKKETISTDIETVSNDTVLDDIKTISTDIETVSTNVVLNFDTVSDTVSTFKKTKPSLLELLILKQMVLRLENGLSAFQTSSVAKAVGTTLGGARNSLNRLKAKGLIENAGYQKGNRIGFTSYKISPKVFEYLRALEPTKETISNDTISTNTVSNTISHYSKKEDSNYTYILTESLKKIGIRDFHLEMFKGSKEDLQDLINHFSFSLEQGEIKSPNKLSLFISLLRDNKSWISEKYLQSINDEIAKNDLRIQQHNDLKKRQKEQELREKFNEFKMSNVNFVKDIKEKNKFTTDDSIIENLAFSEWKTQNEL